MVPRNLGYKFESSAASNYLLLVVVGIRCGALYIKLLSAVMHGFNELPKAKRVNWNGYERRALIFQITVTEKPPHEYQVRHSVETALRCSATYSLDDKLFLASFHAFCSRNYEAEFQI